MPTIKHGIVVFSGRENQHAWMHGQTRVTIAPGPVCVVRTEEKAHIWTHVGFFHLNINAAQKRAFEFA